MSVMYIQGSFNSWHVLIARFYCMPIEESVQEMLVVEKCFARHRETFLSGGYHSAVSCTMLFLFFWFSLLVSIPVYMNSCFRVTLFNTLGLL